MGDMGELWNDVKEAGSRKRASNRETSPQYLREQGIIFATKNNGAHLIVAHNGATVDFWPGTGKWNVRHSRKTGRGVKNLVKFLRRGRQL